MALLQLDEIETQKSQTKQIKCFVLRFIIVQKIEVLGPNFSKMPFGYEMFNMYWDVQKDMDFKGKE